MATPERVRTGETLAQRIERYLPSTELLEAYASPDPISLHRKEILSKTLPGARYSLVFSHLENKLVIVPSWHPLNTSPIPSHGGDYGSGVFEGESMEPVVRNGDIMGANLILHAKRMERLTRSLQNRNFDLPVSIDDFSQAIIDLATIMGEEVLSDVKGLPCRAYVRPEARPGMGGFGVGVKKTHLIEAGATIWNWPFYFKDPERVYKGSGLVIAAFPEQRLAQIKGKHASNYGEAGVIGNRARAIVGVDEAIFFGPYLLNPRTKRIEYVNAQQGSATALKLLGYGVLADGPGEEVFAISSKGEIWYPPMSVNRLGGTTLNYVIEHLAPTLKIPVRERPFSLLEVREGIVASLLYAGNAARIAPIGEVRVFSDDDTFAFDRIHPKITPMVKDIVERYEGEIAGKLVPSDSLLLTTLNLWGGLEAKQILDSVYGAWM